MTERERFIKTLQCEEIGGRVPHFELAFFLTMEAFGIVHPSQRLFSQWGQMSVSEKQLHLAQMADVYILTAERYGHSAIFLHPNPRDTDSIVELMELIRKKSGDKYFLLMDNDPTYAIPDGNSMMEFIAKMYDEPQRLQEASQKRLERSVTLARQLHDRGHLLDGFAMCSDYCFNTNPFFSQEQFGEFIEPFLKDAIGEYHKLGYFAIKHTDGNIMPILKQIAQCKPDAIHSLDPQAGVQISEVRKAVGDKIALIGNVNCGLLQTGSDEECKADILRSLKDGMAAGKGYIFSTSNCVYTGLDLSRYEMMVDLWRDHGFYSDGKSAEQG
jgi:uroporphyrinogen decarboxylase